MRKRGEITVFLAMILLSMCALLCGIAESVRTAGARQFLRTAVNASADSLMAQYHRGLWETLPARIPSTPPTILQYNV